jgi:hypothetical protein
MIADTGHTYKAVIGLDLSVTSPAIAVCLMEQSLNTYSWEFYCFAQRDSDFLAQRREPRLTVWQLSTGPQSSDGSRYHEVVQHIESIIVDISDRTGGVNNILVCIEGYAYGRASSNGNAYKLFELGGALRMKLHTMGVKNVRIISPTAWKRRVLKTGTADKASACRWARDHHIIDLGTAFRVRHRIGTASTEGSRNSVPNPIQDVADAVCIAAYIIMEISGGSVYPTNMPVGIERTVYEKALATTPNINEVTTCTHANVLHEICQDVSCVNARDIRPIDNVHSTNNVPNVDLQYIDDITACTVDNTRYHNVAYSNDDVEKTYVPESVLSNASFKKLRSYTIKRTANSEHHCEPKKIKPNATHDAHCAT